MTAETEIDAADVKEFFEQVERRRNARDRAVATAKVKRSLTGLEQRAVGVFADTLLDPLQDMFSDEEYEKAADEVVEYVVRSPVLLKVVTAIEAESLAIHDGNWLSPALERAADEIIAQYGGSAKMSL